MQQGASLLVSMPILLPIGVNLVLVLHVVV